MIRDDLNPPDATCSPAAESDAVKAERFRRRQEHTDHPERFIRMEEAAVEQKFQDIENEKP